MHELIYNIFPNMNLVLRSKYWVAFIQYLGFSMIPALAGRHKYNHDPTLDLLKHIGKYIDSKEYMFGYYFCYAHCIKSSMQRD